MPFDSGCRQVGFALDIVEYLELEVWQRLRKEESQLAEDWVAQYDAWVRGGRLRWRRSDMLWRTEETFEEGG